MSIPAIDEIDIDTNLFMPPPIPVIDLSGSMPPPIHVNDLSGSTGIKSPAVKFNNNKKRKTKFDLENAIDSEITTDATDYNSDAAGTAGSQSSQTRITKLQNQVKCLESVNKTQSTIIDDLRKLVESLEKRVTNLEKNILTNEENNVEMNILDDQQGNKPIRLFGNLFKTSESKNMNVEIKNIYYVQLDLSEREKKRTILLFMG
jgi:hypothetical protein